MNYIMRLFFLVLLGLSVNAVTGSLLERYTKWKEEFSMVVSKENEESVYKNWVENDKYIEEINSKNLTYSLGHNEFSGMNEQEFREHFSLFKLQGFIDKIEKIKDKVEEIREDIQEVKCVVDCVKEDESNLEKIHCVEMCLNEFEAVSIPTSVNWIEKGAVTEVKNQGQCGSCWSFSTIGALEGAYFIKNNKLEDFSEQQLVDCDNFKNGGKDHGCNGGLMDNAFTWIGKNDGICLDKDYPYVSGDTRAAGICEKSCENVDGTKIVEFVDVDAKSDESMMLALAQQPVSVAIQADQKDFQLYKSGIFTADCGTKLDHGVLLVGYGSENDGDYYLLKNSWGSTWGDKGYMKLGKGSEFNNGSGQCGVLMQGSYPLV